MPKSSSSFKPGQSGNPRGRPKKGLAFAEVLRERLVQAASDGPQDRRTKLQVVVDALISQACTGDVHAAKEIANRLDGRVAEAPPAASPFDIRELFRREAESMELFAAEPDGVKHKASPNATPDE